MNAQELLSLQEAYNQVYELDENRMASRMEKMPPAPAKVGKGTHSIKDIPVSREPSSKEKAKARKALGLGEEHDKDTAQKLSNMRRVMDVEKSAGNTKKADVLQKKMNKLRAKNPTNESYDVYDLILSHLLDEGYADTEQAAEAIMVNMSEEWRDSIVEGIADRAANAVGHQRAGTLGDDDEIRKNQDATSVSIGKMKRGSGAKITPTLPGV